MAAPAASVDPQHDATRAAWSVALERVSQGNLSKDPRAWAWHRLGVWLWSKQIEVAQSVVDNRRTAVRSSHGVGKSFLAAVLALWWVDTHPPGTVKVISTAPSHDQVHGVLWELIRNLHRDSGLVGHVQQSDRWLDDAGRQVGFGRKPPDHADSAFQGYHEEYILVILDEAGGIPDWLWEATEALTTGAHCRVLAIGNPTNSASEFAALRGSDNWATFQISTFDSPNFTGEIDQFPAEIRERARGQLPSREWQESNLRAWGEHSSLYKVRVLGEFADSDDGLIPLSWIDMANTRWLRWHDAGEPEQPGRRIVSCDPAWEGEDMTAFALREADVIRYVERHVKEDTQQTASRMSVMLGHPRALGIVDANGIGAGVYDVLRHKGYQVTPFNASNTTRRRDQTNQWSFRNVRSASWYNLREKLDPALGSTLALPPDDYLVRDLTTPRYWPLTGAKIEIEPKKDQRKRLRRSPDVGDAVAMSLWHNPTSARGNDPESERGPRVHRRRAHRYAGGAGFAEQIARAG